MRDAVAARVRDFVQDLTDSPARGDVLAVVVSGSAAREEERWVDGELESDIDVMVISRTSRLRLDRTRAIQRVLAAHAGANLEGGRIPVSTLEYATLANYEARHRGVVVYGDPAVLDRIPMENPSQIPAWEAMRLVANRLFEHLKLRAGLIGAEAAVIKSYEAIGESQLVLEHRYRPSFGERVAEMERAPLESPVADARARYVAAEGIRRGELSRLDVSPAQALEDLKVQLATTMHGLNLAGDTLGEQIAMLARREFHLAQRVYWMLHGLGNLDGRHRPTADPILQLWREAVTGLSENITDYDSRTLVHLWQQCPQILKKGASS